MPSTIRVGGLRADITARDTGFQAAANRTVRSLNTLQTTANRVQRSFATQNNAARRVVRSYNSIAAAQTRAAVSSIRMNVSLAATSRALRMGAANLLRYIRNLDLTRISTILLNLATSIMTGNFIKAGQAALASFGPQAALAAAAIGTSAAAMRRFNRSTGEATAQLSRMARVGERINVVFSRLVSAAVFVGLAVAAGRMVTAFTNTVDAITNLTNRINLVSEAGTDAADTLERLRDVAEDTRTSLASTGELYTRLAEALQGRLSTDELLKITDTIQRTVVLSGVSAQSAEAALTQLAQGFASGTLRGEELNSVLEQLPRLTRVFTDELGVGIGELRDLAEEGELTTERLGQAILAQATQVQGEFAAQATTVDQALTVTADKFDELVVSIDRAFRVSQGIIIIVEGAGVVFETIAGVFEGVARTWEIIGNILDNLEARGFFNTITSGDLFEGTALEVSAIREELEAAERVLNQRRAAEESILSLYKEQRAEVERLRTERQAITSAGGFFSAFSVRELDKEFQDASVELQYLTGQLATASDATLQAEAEFNSIRGSINQYVDVVNNATEATEELAEEVEKLNSERTIDELDAQLSDEEWYKYATAVQSATDAITRFYDNQDRKAQTTNENAENFNIEQLDARLTDTQFLERQNFLLANQVEFGEEVVEKTKETISEYDRWIDRMERLHAEAQSIRDLELADIGEEIAGRVVFRALEVVEPAVLSIEQLDEALTDNQWLEYADAVAAATRSINEFREAAEEEQEVVRDFSRLTIEQADAALTDEEFLERQAALLRDNAAVLDFFTEEIKETITEYDRWIDRMQALHDEAQQARDLTTAETGEEIAGSILFISEAVERTAQSIEELDASLSDDQWTDYIAEIDRASRATQEFYEERRRGEEEAARDRSTFSISQLDAAISDEDFLERQQQLLRDNAEIAEFFTEETRETINEYDTWIERMRRLHSEASAIAQLNIGQVGEEIAGRITFGAQEIVDPAILAIDALDEALSDNQWYDYTAAVNGANEAIQKFREGQERVLSAQSASTLGIDELDAALTDQQHLERQQQILEDNAEIASFFADETERTVVSYDRWIRRMQELHSEAQAVLDLGVAETGEEIAGSLSFVERTITELSGAIDDLDQSLTDDEWERYTENVRQAQEAIADFYRTRADAPSGAGGLNIEQLDAALSDEQFLERQGQLLRDNAQIAEFFTEETQDTVAEYDRWIERMERLHTEAQQVVDLAVGQTGEEIAGSMEFVAQTVRDVALGIEELDATLSDEQWLRYADAVTQAQTAIDEFYESRQLVSGRNPEELTIEQLDAALTDEQFLEQQAAVLANIVDFTEETTEKTRETVTEYERWIERMRQLHEEAQAFRDLAVAETGEQLAGAVVFNASSRISADRQSIDELDAALSDDQWIAYQEAVDNATDAIDRFREQNEEAFDGATDSVMQFAQALTDQISGSFANAIAGVQSFNDAFEQTAAFIIRRLIEMTLEATIFKNALEGGPGGGGNIIDTILDFFDGPRQGGGPVSGNRAYLVGEAGPELFVPGVDGNIIPNGAFSGGGGLGNLTIQVNGVQDPTIVRAEIERAAPLIAGYIDRDFTNNTIRPSPTRSSVRASFG